ncbi:MAG: type II secretion system protein, partial [Kiritimatiellae bacterium]|nr:type II secretion system protein [Kiritimatiellia bacterium]
MKKGFTLVEMLVVIAVIGILGGIVTTAAVGAIKNGRSKRADAMCVALEQGIAAYYAQEGNWPDAIEKKAQSMDAATYTFTPDEADSIFQDVVGCGFGKGHASHKAMLVDATALFVCD